MLAELGRPEASMKSAWISCQRVNEALKARSNGPLPGRPIRPLELLHRPGLATAYGSAVAAIHDLPVRLIEDAGLPVYSAEEYRFRRLAEVDRAAATGQVPTRLLTRWEHAVEEVGAWRFVPCCVHGDLAGDNVLVEAETVTGIMEWSETRVADPADDLAWLAIGTTEPALDGVLAAYVAARGSSAAARSRSRSMIGRIHASSGTIGTPVIATTTGGIM
jgi:aminoglycoside phosphotransferase (APT) family kinase protein